MNKENDWFLAISENPTFEISQFSLVGLTPENTQLREKSYYENNKYIQLLYQTDGKFDKAKFEQAYNIAAASYQSLNDDDIVSKMALDYEYDMYNSTRPVGAKIKKPEIEFKKVANPLKQVYGFGGIGSISDPTITISEAAQKSKIYDWTKLEFIDRTPNDDALENSLVGYVKSIFEPLVLATYDSDTETIDPITGAKIKHKKGEYKVNEDGDYYYETLGGRSAYGKKVKSIFDTLTVDGSSLNKYDFFDSDGLDKSVSGTLAKTAASIIPLFTPIAPYYGYAMVGTQLMDLLPTLYNTIAGNFSKEDTTLPFFNLMLGISRSFKGSTSEYSQSHLFSLENFANTIADVALLWQQQRTIADLFKKANASKINNLNKQLANEASQKGLESTVRLQGTYNDLSQNINSAYKLLSENKLKPLLEANNRMAANASLGYMAGMQAFEIYEDTLAQGATKTEAALMAWGAALGMYKVDRTGLGELFFPELQSDAKIYRAAINTLKLDISKGYLIAQGIKDTRSKLFKIMDSARNASSKYWQGIKEHSLGFFGKSLGEGIEEVSEELVTDFTKSTFNMLLDLGLTVSKDKMDAWDNAGDRYLMNFFGGAIGGAVFYGVDTVLGRNTRPDNEKLELTYLLRNGKKSELLKELGVLQSKGKLGSTTLSGTKTEQVGETLNWLTADNEKDSQNSLIANLIRRVIEVTDRALHQEGLDMSDDLVLDKIILGDQRLSKIQEAVGITGTQSRLVMDFNKISLQIADKILEIELYKKTSPDVVESKERATNNGKTEQHNAYEAGLAKLEKELSDLRKRRDFFFSELSSAEYVDKLLFEIDESVNYPFYKANFSQYIKAKTGKEKEELTAELLTKLQEDFIKYKEATKYDKFDEAYNLYKHFNEKFTETVNDKANSYEEHVKVREILWNELVDQERTDELIQAGKVSSIDELKEMFLDGKVDIDPILKIEYNPEYYNPDNYDPNLPELLLSPEEIKEFLLLDDAQKAVRRTEIDLENRVKYKEALKNKATKIREIIKKFKDVGFIDTQTKRLLQKAIGTTSLETILRIYGTDSEILDKLADIDNLLTELQENLLNITNGVDPLFESKELISTLNKELTNLSNDILKIIDKINGDNDAEIENNIRDLFSTFEAILELDLADDYEFLLYEDVKNKIISSVLAFSEIARNTENYILLKELDSELSTVKNSPLYEFLKQILVETGSTNSTVFDLLEKLNGILDKSSIEGFELDNVLMKEIESALTALDIVESLINAASSEELSLNKLYGHNAIYNDFISKLSGIKLLGIIRSDLAEMMKGDINLLRTLLEFLKRISNLNSANSLNAQKQTGLNLNRMLGSVLKGVGDYSELHSIQVNGIKLFDGISDIDTPILLKLIDKEDVDESGRLELDELELKVANNYLYIKDKTGLSDVELAKIIVPQVIKIFNKRDLSLRLSTIIDLHTESLMPIDVANYLFAVISLPKKEFNQLYQSVLPKYSKVPLPALEHLLFLGTAFSKNKELFKDFVSSSEIFDKVPGPIETKLHRLLNIFGVNGVGGAGKTTMLVILNELQCNYVDKARTDTYVIAPYDTLVKNANSIINAEKLFTIESFIEHILDPEEFAEFKKYIENKENSKLFSFDKDTYETKLEKLLSKIKFRNTDKIRNIIVDEYTHLDIATGLILSALALKLNIIVNFSGDSFLNGYEYKDNSKEVKRIENPNRFNAFFIEAPKLSVSMRSKTILKRKNGEVLVTMASYADLEINKTTIPKILNDLQILFDTKPLLYYEGEDEPLSGEKIVSSLEESKIRKLLATGELLIYVYDESENPIITKLKSEFSEKILSLTPDKVLGLEAPYVIVDINFEKHGSDISDYVSNLYTMLTRSETGTLIVDKNLTKIFPNLKTIPTSYVEKSLDADKLAEKLKELSDKRLEELAESINQLEDYKSASPIPPTPPVITADLEGVTKAITQLTTDIENSEISRTNKDNLLQQLGEINKQVKDDADFDHLLDEINKLRALFEEIISKTSDLITKLGIIKDRAQVIDGWLESPEFKTFLGDDYDDLLSNFTTFKDSLEKHINEKTDVPDSELKILELIETKLSDYNRNSEKMEDDPVINDKEEETPLTDPTPEIEVEKNSEGKIIKNKIRTYGFYTRLGDENGDLQMLLSLFSENSDKEKIEKVFLQIKSVLLYHNLEEASEILNQIILDNNDLFPDPDDETDEASNIVNDLYAAINDLSGEFKIVLKHEFNNSDKPITPIPDFNLDKIVGLLVYEFNTRYGKKRITLGAIADPETWIAGAKTIESRADARAYANYIAEQKAKLNSSNPEIEIKVKAQPPTNFTNLHRLGSETFYNMELFKKLNPNAITSPIYVSSANEDPDERRYAGKPVMFVTNDHYRWDEIEEKWIKIQPEDLPKLYELNKAGGKTGAQIRKVILDFEGLWVTSFRSNGTITRGLFDIQKEVINSLEGQSLAKFLDTLASNMTGINMFTSIWNWRAELISLLEKLAHKPDSEWNGTIGKNGIVLLVTSLDTAIAIGSRSNRVLIKSKEVLDLWVGLLDDIIDLVGGTYGISSNLASMSKTELIEGHKQVMIGDKIKSVAAGHIDINGTELQIAKGNLMITLLSLAYRAIRRVNITRENSGEHDVFEDTSSDVTTLSIVEADIEAFRDMADNILPSKMRAINDGELNVAGINIFNSMLNIMFHGKKYVGDTIYSNYSLDRDKTGIGDTIKKFVRFPYGVFYHAKIEKDTSGSETILKKYRPLFSLNYLEQFKVNVLILDPNMVVELEMEEAADVKAPDSRYSKAELPKSVTDFLKDLGITEEDADEDEKKFLKSIKDAWLLSFDARDKNILETKSRYPKDLLEELFRNDRDPDKHLLFTFRNKLAEIFTYKSTLFRFIKRNGTKAPIKINIITDNTDRSIKIETRETLAKFIGEQSITLENGFFTYIEDGILKSFNITSDGAKLLLHIDGSPETTNVITFSEESLLNKGEHRIYNNEIDQIFKDALNFIKEDNKDLFDLTNSNTLDAWNRVMEVLNKAVPGIVISLDKLGVNDLMKFLRDLRIIYMSTNNMSIKVYGKLVHRVITQDSLSCKFVNL